MPKLFRCGRIAVSLAASRYDVPVVETARLILRGHRLDDLDECIAMWADPIVTRFIGGKPSTPQQTWSRILGYVGHWALLGFGYWAIEEKASGRFIGELGFADFKRNIAAPMKDVPELGWALVSHEHGRGFATEAARAVVAWGDERLATPRTVCLIDPENVASLRIAATCGYNVFERTSFNEKSILFLERLRPSGHNDNEKTVPRPEMPPEAVVP